MAKRITPLERAIAIAGSSKTLAGWIGVTPQALSQWKQVPGGRVLAVERCTGVTRYDLRPDIYPREQPADFLARRAEVLQIAADGEQALSESGGRLLA